MVLTGGPHPSAAREKKKGMGGEPARPGPRRRKGARGFMGHKAEKKEGEERKTFPFYFPNKISKLFSK